MLMETSNFFRGLSNPDLFFTALYFLLHLTERKQVKLG